MQVKVKCILISVSLKYKWSASYFGILPDLVNKQENLQLVESNPGQLTVHRMEELLFLTVQPQLLTNEFQMIFQRENKFHK